MIKNNTDKIRKKRFIEETLGTRKYFSYRSDLIFSKLIICLITFIIMYLLTLSIFFSSVIVLQVFLIFTLINKLNMDRKAKQGEKKLINNIEKEYFIEKINDLDEENFEKLIKTFFEKEGYNVFLKIGEHIYSTEKNNKIKIVKILKLCQESEIEKIDIRSFVTFLSNHKINNSCIVTVNELSEEAQSLYDKVKDKFNIEIIDTNKLFEQAQKYEFLPDKKYYYEKINNLKTKKKNKIVKENTFDIKKFFVYIFAAIFFFIISKLMPYNTSSIVITYYFLLLAFVNLIYNVYLKQKKIIEENR